MVKTSTKLHTCFSHFLHRHLVSIRLKLPTLQIKWNGDFKERRAGHYQMLRSEVLRNSELRYETKSGL
ncbi:hypothetical protein REPUB_Repub11eG0171500 [Reevesia pubescens]